MKKIISFLFIILVFEGCSSTAFLHKQQTTVTYSDRLPGRIGLYIPDNIKNNLLECSSSGSSCGAYSFNIELGSTLSEAIRSGVETACNEVVILDAMPNSSTLKSSQLKFAIVPRLTNANGDVSFSTGFFKTPVKGTFQASITFSLMDANGKTFYSFSSNGSGFENASVGSCSGAADVVGKAAETAIQQIADNIAQTLNSSKQIQDAVK